MSLAERRQWIAKHFALSAQDMTAWSAEGGLSVDAANQMIENAVGVYALPLGIAQYFIVNGKPVLVPMAIEEPSVIAGVSFMAKLAQAGGGFRASATAPEMIGQIQLLDLADLAAAESAILPL